MASRKTMLHGRRYERGSSPLAYFSVVRVREPVAAPPAVRKMGGSVENRIGFGPRRTLT